MTPEIVVIDKYTVEAQTIAPMHIGSGEKDTNEILIHPIWDRPFIQASGIAGALRAVSEAVNGTKVTQELFGGPHLEKDDSPMDVKSRLRISDGMFDPKTVHLEFRPRVRVSRRTGSVSSGTISGSGMDAGHKFEMEMIGSGARLCFTVYLRYEQKESLRDAFEAVLAECMSGRVRFGGQKSNGNGAFHVCRLYRCSFDMSNELHRKAWGVESLSFNPDVNGKNGEEPAGQLINPVPKQGSSSAVRYEVNVAAKTEGALLVKGISAEDFGAGAPDAENMRNAAGEYIVPGSSLKGALRSRMEQLADMLGKKSLVTSVFGTVSGGAKNSRGILMVQDVIVSGKDRSKQELLQHRIHIDKFTSGVIQSGLFSEKTVSGNLSMHIDIENRNDPDAAAGLLVLAFRDLAIGAFNIGSGYSVGRGFVDVKLLQLKSVGDGKTAEIDFETGIITDESHLLDRCLQALNGWEER